jgi:hypothetical protein
LGHPRCVTRVSRRRSSRMAGLSEGAVMACAVQGSPLTEAAMSRAPWSAAALTQPSPSPAMRGAGGWTLQGHQRCVGRVLRRTSSHMAGLSEGAAMAYAVQGSPPTEAAMSRAQGHSQIRMRHAVHCTHPGGQRRSRMRGSEISRDDFSAGKREKDHAISPDSNTAGSRGDNDPGKGRPPFRGH